MESLNLTLKYFGPRLLATAGGWYANDIFFYGNKLFQSEFIKVIVPGSHSIMPGWLYNLINVGVSLVGYYLASFLIDNKLYGRKWMQIVGFMVRSYIYPVVRFVVSSLINTSQLDFILFIVPAFNFEYYTRPENIKAFQAMCTFIYLIFSPRT